ncbi:MULTISPECIES: transcription termination factor Rho [Eisenbergiella]|uniref:Transcription termination factor Rho n=1 Tax=Eisenbergiella porci TaxID=2652274 RepID=A0A6N7VWT1_9FIRM|nr:MULTISPECIES: transcription termination factor Rho [Eisenbergiella]MCI6708996.1 transcription termination factor Rho [Eisenbergiella massiliensis]MDY2654089.1 transcription termination factor Rho [Eisenbergiella porci]MDY5526595.1 transcription termination factor Rho [Eisenbergiella porci]MSS87496.1 transcription termination factor Rho [Eisenbergiella porci]
MREKYQSLALADLKEIAKSRGIKGTSGMKKADIIEAMVALDEEAEGRPGTPVRTEEKGDAADKAAAAPKKSRSVSEKPLEKTAPEKRTAEKPSEVKSSAEKEEEAAPAETEGQARVQNVQQAAPQVQNATQAQSAAQPQAVTQPQSASQSQQANQSQTASQNRPAERGTDRKPMRRNTQNENGSRRNYGNQEQRSTRTIIMNNNDNRQNTPGSQQGERTYNGERSVPQNRSYNTERAESSQQDNPMPVQNVNDDDKFPSELDSGVAAHGILEVMPDGYGFIRCANYLPGENDVYVAPSQIRRFNLKTGDIVEGNTRIKTQNEKFSALLYVKSINGYSPDVAARRCNFEDMTPIFPEERVRLELSRSSTAMRIMDLMSPVGKGQRGMIVSPPKAGKTTLLKQVAQSVKVNNPDMHLIILLIDERPEEVTDFREAIEGPNVEVIYSTFDELPEHHKRVSEMVIERAKRLVEHKKDVMILLDSITRLTRAYNLVIPPSGRTLSGGLDPAALHMPKRFFGAARNMRGGGSLTILATALVDTGSKMDDVIYEEFKGTGNMEIVLDRKLSERRVFPAIDIPKSGTRREDLLLTPEELEAIGILRKALNSLKPEEAVDKILDMFARTRNNTDFVNLVKKMKFI